MTTQSNQLVTVIQGSRPAIFAGRNLPSMSAAAQQGLAASYGIIGYKGRNWRIKYRGEEELLMEGNVPVATLNVIIVGVATAISKQYYGKKFSEGDDSAPDCYSNNGVTPEPGVTHKQHTHCATCPMNVWGSRVTENGKRAKACQDSRRIAVVPRGDIKNEGYGGPFLLRLPPMTLNAFAKYNRDMQRFGAEPFMVGTTLGFNYDVAYPLITFTAEGWLSDEEAEQVTEVLDDPLIPQMLNETPAAEEEAAEEGDNSAAALAGGKPTYAEKEAEYAAVAAAQAAEAKAEYAAVAAAQAAEAKAKAQAAASAAPAAGKAASAFGAKAPSAPAAAPKTGGFGAKAATTVVAKPVADTQPVVDKVETKVATVVQGAPSDMEAAIDDLLG